MTETAATSAAIGTVMVRILGTRRSPRANRAASPAHTAASGADAAIHHSGHALTPSMSRRTRSLAAAVSAKASRSR